MLIIYFPPFRKERERMGHPAKIVPDCIIYQIPFRLTKDLSSQPKAAALHNSCSVESVIGRKNKVGKKCPGKLEIAH